MPNSLRSSAVVLVVTVGMGLLHSSPALSQVVEIFPDNILVGSVADYPIKSRLLIFTDPGSTFSIRKIETPPAPFSFLGGQFPGQGGDCQLGVEVRICSIWLEMNPAGASATQSTTYTGNLDMILDGVDPGPRTVPLTAIVSPRIEADRGGEFGSNLLGRHSPAAFKLNFGVSSVINGLQIQGLSAPFGYWGGALPGQNGSCATEMDFSNHQAICSLFLEFQALALGPRTATITFNFQENGTPRSYSYTLKGEGYQPSAAKNVLVVYNSASKESSELADYYLHVRPEFAGANLLAVQTSTTEFAASEESFQAEIANPIYAWIANHPKKDIRYIVLMRGIPSRIDFPGRGDVFGHPSVSYELAQYQADPLAMQYGAWNNLFFSLLGSIPNVYIGGFSSARYPGTRALVTHMNMGSEDATRAYIDKLAAAYQVMRVGNVVISASVPNGTYYAEDVRPSGIFSVSGRIPSIVAAENPSASVVYQPDSHIHDASNVVGYTSWGYNGGLGGDYPTDGQVLFNGDSGWYLIRTIESFNGRENTFQGNFVKWFSELAFGGQEFRNTPVGAVTHVEEPGLAGSSQSYSGPNGENLYAFWERGYLFAEAAWASRQTPFFMAVGDPLVVKKTP